MVECTCKNCGKFFRLSKAENCDRATCSCSPESASQRRDHQACEHFVEITDQITEAACGGCQTAKAQTALAECERHGLVTFIARAKDESIRCCQDCKDYQPEKTRVRSDAR